MNVKDLMYYDEDLDEDNINEAPAKVIKKKKLFNEIFFLKNKR